MASRADNPDRALVAAFLSNRGEAPFRQLYRRHTPRMLRLGRKLTGGWPASAEDIVQESWVRAVRTLDRFEWRSSLATWLGGIVVNVVREQRRRAVPPPAASEPEAGWLDPIAGIALARSMQALSPGYRSVVALHDLAGFTHEEIGRILCIDPGTSKSQLARARRRLRASLASEGGGDDH